GPIAIVVTVGRGPVTHSKEWTCWFPFTFEQSAMGTPLKPFFVPPLLFLRAKRKGATLQRSVAPGLLIGVGWARPRGCGGRYLQLSQLSQQLGQQRRAQIRCHKLGRQGSQHSAGGHSTGTLRQRLTHTSSGTHTLTRLQTVVGTHSVTVYGTRHVTV